MSWVSLVSFAICIGCIASLARRGADVFSPFRFFLFIWALAIGLTDLKLSKLQHTWTPESWIFVLLGPCFFLVGAYVVSVLNMNADVRSITAIRGDLKKTRLDANRMFFLIVVLFFLYALAYFVIFVIKDVTPPLFSLDPGVSRRQFTLFGLGLFLHNVVLIAFFTVLYHISFSGDRFVKSILKGLSVISIVTYVFLLQRFQLLMTVVMCLVIVYYMTNHLRLSTFLVYVSITFGLFLLISTLRAGQLFIYYLHQASQMTFSREYAIFTEPYMYIVMNLENLARAVTKESSLSFGAFTFDFSLAAVGLKDWVREYFQLDETPFLLSGYNTYTAYWTYFRDFGAAGVAVLSFLVGAGISTIYYRMRRFPRLEYIAAYAVCVFMMAASYFNSPLSFLWFVYNLVVLAGGIKLAQRSSVVG